MNYTIEFKLKAVNFAETNSIRSAAEKFKVERKRIRNWKQNKAKLLSTVATPSGSKRKKLGGGRKPMNEVLEEHLIEWIHDP